MRGSVVVGMLATLLGMLGAGCASEPKDSDEWPAAEAALSQAVGELSQVEASMNAVLLRRSFTIRVPTEGLPIASARRAEPLRPSDVYTALVGDPRLPHAEAMQRLLDQADARKPIGAGDSTDCVRDSWQDEPTAKFRFSPNFARAHAAKRLDARLRVVIERCPSRGTQLNNPAAALPIDTDSFAIASEAETARYKALNAMYALTREDLRAVMLAQAYYFDQTEDAKIPISSFLERSATQTSVAVSAALMPFALKPRAVSMVFDRSNTAIREQLEEVPRGWFNAIANNDTLYVSPTIVRASLVACAGRVAFTPGFVHRLREDLISLRQRRITPAAVWPGIRAAQQQITGLNSCIADQLTFLFAHELAHALLEMKSEERADCIGAAVAQYQRKADSGIFDALIFRTVGTDDEDLLGADKYLLAELSCRRKAPYIRKASAIVDLKTAVSACQAIAQDCSYSTP